jgi:hypothetical protein
MDITLGEEQIFRLLPMVDMERAREKAWDKKTAVFGSGLSALISRPRAENVQISYSECRYEPFWRIVCQVHYEYERKRNYIVPIIAPEVQRVTINGMEYPVAAKPHQFTIDGVEHCIEKASTEVIYDAVRSQQRDWKSYLRYDKEIVTDLANFAPKESIVVQPEMHASAAVRQVLTSVLRPIQADTVHEEKVDIQTVALYFRPVYAFCVVPKLLTLYTHHWCMGKKNKIVKLTPRKIRYIIRYKTNNYSTKSIAKDLKISESTVKRVWMHWIRTKTP